MEILDRRAVIEKGAYDVIVVGGGIAGIAAAVSAGRSGAKTLLMEKSVLLGGLATAGLISWYEPLCDHRGTKMIGGIAEELIRLSMAYGFDTLPECWQDGINAGKGHGRYATFYSPTVFALALDAYLEENQVDLILDCMAVFPVMEGGRCAGIAAETKEGRVYYPGKAFVDATGDASLFAQAGLPTVCGENFMTYVAQGYSHHNITQYEKADEKSMSLLRKWRSVGSDFQGNGHPAGMKKLAGVTAEEVTEYVRAGQRLLFEEVKREDRHLRDLSMVPSMPQFRTVRHIVGEYDFVAVDGEVFADSIGSCGDFRVGTGAGKHYHVPYRSLYTSDCDNMIAAGRIISASGDGWEVTRVIPVCALTGQAAGTAAAQTARTNTSFAKLNVAALRENLKQAGILFV